MAMSKNLSGKASYKIILDCETVSGLNFDPGFIGGEVTLTIGSLSTKGLSGSVLGIGTDLVELTCSAESCVVAMKKKVVKKASLPKAKSGAE